jgi:YidC/Oxa1 family membrane protein insertase
LDRNLFLAFALSFAVLTGWMLLTGPPPGAGPQEQSESHRLADQAAEGGSAPPVSDTRVADTLPPTGSSTQTPTPAGSGSPAVGAVDAAPERIVRIDLPLYTTELTSLGGGIRSWRLKEFRETADPESERVELITGQVREGVSFLTPFDELGIGDLSQRAFEVVSEDFESVAFETSENGVTVRKTYHFDPEGYTFRLLLEVENGSSAAVGPRFRVDIPARQREGTDFTELALGALQDGDAILEPLAGLGSPGFLGSLTGKTAQPYVDYLGEIDWAGVQTTYFLNVVFPDSPSQANVRMAATEPGTAGTAQLFFDETLIPPGQTAGRELRAFLGPKEVERLEALGGEAIRSIDLGWSWVEPLTKFFSLFLHALYSLIPNYGVAIILLTIIVRVVTAPLTIKQMRSMERMRALAPKLKEIQEKHKDDRAKSSEETMALYRSEGVNPLGGCLPMVLQFPVFIGLFYALRSTIQLRQSPFFGWIDDLSAPETLFELPGLGLPVRILPIIMGATMVLQQKITPMQADPAQARMMMTVMPVVMTFVFYQFPSGLVLYWMVSNVLAITHQLIIGRNMRKGA